MSAFAASVSTFAVIVSAFAFVWAVFLFTFSNLYVNINCRGGRTVNRITVVDISCSKPSNLASTRLDSQSPISSAGLDLLL